MSENLGACASMNLRKTSRLVAQLYDKKLQPSGLRTTQFTLLANLMDFEPVSVTTLAEKLGMERTTLTRNVRLLEREGLTNWQVGDDARVRLLSLTKKGRKVFEDARPYWEEAQKDFLEKFGKQRWQQLHGELMGITKIVMPE